MEEGVRAVYAWSREKKLSLSIEKCEVGFFTSDTSEFEWKPNVEVEGRVLPFTPNPKFPGVKYDRMFSFTDQAKKACGGDLLLRVYKSTVQSGSDYCAAGWQPWLSAAGEKSLSQAQNR